MDFKVNIDTPREVEVGIALKAKKIRLQYNLTRKTLSNNSGVSLSSIKRFETTGKISLTSLLKIASALGSLDDFLFIFKENDIASIADLEKVEKSTNRRRGTI